MTSVPTVVEFSRSLNNRSRSAGASGVLAVGAARAVMQSLLRHAHTDERRSGCDPLEARVPPPARGEHTLRYAKAKWRLTHGRGPEREPRGRDARYPHSDRKADA